MRIIDLHCDTVMYFYKGERLTNMEARHISRDKLINGEIMAQCFAIFIPTGRAAVYHNIHESPEVYFEKAYQCYVDEMENNKDILRRAYTAQDIEDNRTDGKISSILTVEDGVGLAGNLEMLDDYHRKGVRMITLTWNHENELGYPCSDDFLEHRRGLKSFGIDAVRKMNELGIAVDVSHLSEGGFWDVAKHSCKPFLASHSCARSVHNHRRNLSDEQLRAVADSGGIVGINFLARFLHDYEGPEQNCTSIEDISRHLLHMKNIAGIHTLYIGSDYDGMGSKLEWGDCGGSQQLLRGLEKVFTADEIEKIAYKNALRFFKATIK